MIKLSLKIIDIKNNIKASNEGIDEVGLVYNDLYEEGDKIVITSSEKDIFIIPSIDETMDKSILYLKDNEITYNIPFNEKRNSYSPKAFYGDINVLNLKVADENMVKNYRNLALNPMDQDGMIGLYPHSSANIETRGEAVFATRNVINGNCENKSHGNWPYESWGIGMRDDAELKLDFGRSVIIDKIVLYTRSDFPHDNWWTNVTFEFENNEMKSDLVKSYDSHIIEVNNIKTSYLIFKDLIKSEDPSPFPALSQIEVYGYELE